MKKGQVIENITIEDIASEGNALFKNEGKVFFISNTIPGDVVDVKIIKNKTGWGTAELLSLKQKSPLRIEPFCEHFTVCGGCKWQMLEYSKQVEYKTKEVVENFKRIGKIHFEKDNIQPRVIVAGKIKSYRNKVEFAFSNKTFLTKMQLDDKNISAFKPALGFHTTKIFDKIIHIDNCGLMENQHNHIRNAIFKYSVDNHYTFYDRRTKLGLLRNLVIKMTRDKQVLVNLIFAEADNEKINNLMNFIKTQFSDIKSLYYTINTKFNDTIYDLTPQLFNGQKHITEHIGHFKFNIGPKSFFQTNSFQTENLYKQVLEYAELSSQENILDLYCGVGSIGIFLSPYAKQILGIEIIQEAINDANINAQHNNLNNIRFIQGDIEKLVKNNYFETLGFSVDVLIVDPPRAGLSEKLIPIIFKLNPKKIVYVSCNSATQSRDLALLKEQYTLKKVSVVDMFPHTYHIETVVQLIRNN